MKNKLILTDDGSHSLYSPKSGESYHSRFGAVQESMTVFIRSGLEVVEKESISILEMGFGTGLNALLTLDYARKNSIKVEYETIELYPISPEEAGLINYPEVLKLDEADFMELHKCPWGIIVDLSAGFSIRKHRTDIRKFLPERTYDLIYYDAFSPDSQPDLWEPEIFRTLYQAMNMGGILTSYSVRGDFRRALTSAGFKVEKLPGPPGKRHITRAVKID